MEEMLQKGGALAIISVSALMDMITEAVESAVERRLSARDGEDLTPVTIARACEMLGVDKSTLWHWDKEGILKKYHVGGKPRYRLGEVKALMEGRPSNGTKGTRQTQTKQTQMK